MYYSIASLQLTCNYFPSAFNMEILTYAFADVSFVGITWASAVIKLDFPWASDMWLQRLNFLLEIINTGCYLYLFLFCFHSLEELFTSSIGSLGSLSPSCLSNDFYPCIFPWDLRQTLSPLLMVLRCALLGALCMVFPPDSSCLGGLLREVFWPGGNRANKTCRFKWAHSDSAVSLQCQY